MALPREDRLLEFEQKVEEITQDLARKAHTARLQNYEQRCRDTKSLKPAYQAVKGRTPPKPQILDSEAGGKTGSIEELLRTLYKAWWPLFNSYAWEARPTWAAFYAKYEKFVRKRWSPMTLEEIRPEQLRNKVCAWPKWKAAGLDGWEVEYLQQLPLEWWERVADYLNVVVQDGKWHSSHAKGYFSFIGKGAGDGPLDQRPLTILPVVYRIWAAVRLDESASWIARWIHPKCAATQGRNAEDLWTVLAQRVEVNKARQCPHGGLSVDLAKCFDKVPFLVAIELMEHLGLSKGVVRALRGTTLICIEESSRGRRSGRSSPARPASCRGTLGPWPC
jgi:hypothetical protein